MTWRDYQPILFKTLIICEILSQTTEMHRPTKDFTDYQFEWKVPHFPGQKHISLINK